LVAINQTPQEASTVRSALWRSAVIHFIKCFGESRARFQLSAERIFAGRPPEAMVAFQFFRDLRNKHLVHDENSYAQSIAAAVLNKGDKNYKIEKIVCISTIADVLGQENWANLKLLIDTTYSWVVAEFDSLTALITKDLEAQTYEVLSQMEGVEYHVPTVDEMGIRRR
jgi:hypothetical protein